MKLSTLLNASICTKIEISYLNNGEYIHWHVDYTRLGERHINNLHYVGAASLLPDFVLKKRVEMISINNATGELSIVLK